MKRFAIGVLTAAFLVATYASTARAAAPPADRVVAIYFHRTQRCPTCIKMGGYSEEAVNKGFAKQIKEGKVKFHHIDFQDKKNAALAKGYKITGPALVVVKVKENKVKEYKDLKDIWTKVSKKPEFIKYVRENVEAYLKKGAENK